MSRDEALKETIKNGDFEVGKSERKKEGEKRGSRGERTFLDLKKKNQAPR